MSKAPWTDPEAPLKRLLQERAQLVESLEDASRWAAYLEAESAQVADLLIAGRWYDAIAVLGGESL